MLFSRSERINNVIVKYYVDIDVQHVNTLTVQGVEQPTRPVATRLACTIGPQSRSVEVLTELLKAGMTVGASTSSRRLSTRKI